MEQARQYVADRALFMTMAIKLRSAPPTEVVKKGQVHHRFQFGFPVVIKPFDDRPMIVAETKTEAERVTRELKSVGYQVQKHLQGYTFCKVHIKDGLVEEGHPPYIYGSIRMMVSVLVLEGLRNFTLTVATNKVRTYIIGAQLR